MVRIVRELGCFDNPKYRENGKSVTDAIMQWQNDKNCKIWSDPAAIYAAIEAYCDGEEHYGKKRPLVKKGRGRSKMTGEGQVKNGTTLLFGWRLSDLGRKLARKHKSPANNSPVISVPSVSQPGGDEEMVDVEQTETRVEDSVLPNHMVGGGSRASETQHSAEVDDETLETRLPTPAAEIQPPPPALENRLPTPPPNEIRCTLGCNHPTFATNNLRRIHELLSCKKNGDRKLNRTRFLVGFCKEERPPNQTLECSYCDTEKILWEVWRHELIYCEKVSEEERGKNAEEIVHFFDQSP